MKVNLLYDVVTAPTPELIQQIRDLGIGSLGSLSIDPKPLRIRFVRTVSLPALLVKGQSYYLRHDPLTGYEYNNLEVASSGVYEDDEGKPIPFVIIEDDHWLSFDNWYNNKCEDRNRSPVDLYNEWRSASFGQRLNLIFPQFIQFGWRRVLTDDPEQHIE